MESCTDTSAAATGLVTGGCLAGDSRCCPRGCCEFVNIASRCSLLADGLPPCGACMSANRPSYADALTDRLPEPARTVAAAYLSLVKRTVLNTVLAPAAEKVDGHVWPSGDDVGFYSESLTRRKLLCFFVFLFGRPQLRNCWNWL